LNELRRFTGLAAESVGDVARDRVDLGAMWIPRKSKKTMVAK
jgi:hypothetical protein